jgi:serine/threonine-protein kinase
MIGKSIAHYRVTEMLGAGGMGEVYRATDSKLGRDVAIKVLPASVAGDPSRLGRLQREAQVLAALNHPHIAAIYGVEESGSTRALVMELVDGLTLAGRIAESPLPLEEALPIAKQIAEAVEYAHDKGVVHRDLKPGNVKLTSDHKVKVLDFGLAKALEDAPASVEASTSPTLSIAASRAGVILGTAAYMSPEQAKGKPADRRADIWAFGVVLYEMLTGKQLFTGETVSETLAHVITQPPNLDSLPAGTPRRVRKLLERCLTRDPKLRLQAMGEARIILDDVIANPAVDSETAAASAGQMPAVQQPLWQRALPWAVAGAAIVAAIVIAWAPWRPAPVAPLVSRMMMEIGAPASIGTGFGPGAVLSPNGTHIAFVARDASQRFHLYVRAVNQLEATLLSGTGGARDPFFSPDGQWLGFIADSKLKKIAITGGAAVTLCDAPTARGAWWAEDGTIILTASNREPLVRVSDSGGKPEPVAKFDATRGEVTQRWPQVLPGGKAILFTSHTAGANFDDAYIMVLDMETGDRKTVHQGGFSARYVPSGHIVYAHRGTLFALPFDLKRMEVTGQAAPFQEKVATNTGLAGAQFAFDNTGKFLYLPGADQATGVQILWMDQAGKFKPLRATFGDYLNPRLSPEGKRLALQVNTAGEHDIWIYDWARDTMTRLTFEAGFDAGPIWTPDGKRITYASEQKGKQQSIYWRNADGTGEAQLLLETKDATFPQAWSPDGKTLAFQQRAPDTGWDMWLLPMEGDEKSGWKPGTPREFLKTPATESGASISPDGRWIAYNSNESGEFQIYVRPLHGEGGKWQVSSAPGVFPRWAKNGKELFFRTYDSQIMMARYRVVGSSFQHDKPELWSPGQFSGRGTNSNFDLAPDGKQIAVLKIAEATENTEKRIDKIVLVQNVFEELRRVAPPKKK